MEFNRSRLIVAALRGGAGKTVVSLGLAAAWRRYLGLRIIPFKKGPDYIDAGWLSAAAGHPCYNLDPYLMKPEEIVRSFVLNSGKGDGSLIEGNRGLYDGVDARGSYSTAELAKLLRAPVVLVLDATKVTRTAAALVLGCQHLDPEVNIAGVILNRVSGKRHEKVLRDSIEECCGLPVLGVVPREEHNLFPERHLGLVPPQETGDLPEAVSFATSRMREYLDLEELWNIASQAGPLGFPAPVSATVGNRGETVKIGIIRDSAFQFYYPENLEALEQAGAVLTVISSLEDRQLPEVDALYIGGGFPETHLDILAANETFRESVRSGVEKGLPVYAECGGLMFLCRGIHHQGKTYPMAGVFPFEIVLGAKPQGHGYTTMECVGENPFFPKGAIIRGHEFHYSGVADRLDPDSYPFVFKLKKGHGIVAGWDGICYKNVLAAYSHLHAVGNEFWAHAIVDAARKYHRNRTGISAGSRFDPDRLQAGSQSHQSVN